MLKRLLIANRGEIACRIIDSCRRLGVATVAVYSEADANARHVRAADHSVAIGPAPPSESYLDGERIIAAALESGADAIHPGYGFLSENAGFARAVEAAGLVFVGPQPETIEQMGSKAAAKQIMAKAGVPVVPGYHGDAQDEDTLTEQARQTGYPLMIKAAAGGGGKGMRIVNDAAALDDAIDAARRESRKAFGDDRLIMERYLARPRHIEFQVFGDSQGQVIHLGERDCSTQRRYQKVLEEAPSPTLDADTRLAMGEAAVAAARAVDYRGAGTVEFIVSEDGDFYFMEMNTRLQVEHPVTEMITGLDLVEWQLRVAAGEALPLAQDQVRSQGHAIEARIYAEDPNRDFLPASGHIDKLVFPPAGDGVRIDSGVVAGDDITVHYDPMVAKLICHGENRRAAVRRLAAALADSALFGPANNLGFLQYLVDSDTFRDGEMHTAYLDRELDQVLQQANRVTPADRAAAALAVRHREDQRRPRHEQDPHSPWQAADSWRVGHIGARVGEFEVGELRYRSRIEMGADGLQLAITGGDDEAPEDTLILSRWQAGDDHLHFVSNGRRHDYHVFHCGAYSCLTRRGQRFMVRLIPLSEAARAAAGDSGDVRAPMPGQVVSVAVAAGDEVTADQPVMILEAMKMELTLRAAADGVVASVNAAPGEFVEADAVLVAFADPGAAE